MDTTKELPAQTRQAEYGQEVLCASWNPLVTALAEPAEASPEHVAEPATGDVESFLASFYRSEQG